MKITQHLSPVSLIITGIFNPRQDWGAMMAPLDILRDYFATTMTIFFRVSRTF